MEENKEGRMRFKQHVPFCPECDKPMVIKNGQKGWFFGCSQFPNCRGSLNLHERDINLGYDFNRNIIHGYSIIDCKIDGKDYKDMRLIFKDYCFGVMTDDKFVLLRDCEDIEVAVEAF